MLTNRATAVRSTAIAIAADPRALVRVLVLVGLILSALVLLLSPRAVWLHAT